MNLPANKNIMITTIVSSFIIFVLLYLSSVYIETNYWMHSFSKIVLFILGAFVISYILNRKVVPEYLYLKGRKRDSLIRGGLFGIVFFSIFMIAYFFLKKYLDLDTISKQIHQDYNVTSGNFILIGLHITFFNSFIEEFFFRGFVFFNLYNSGYKKTAFIYSSVLFGLYHIIIFWGWFSMPIFFLALFALIAVGFLFNWMNIKTKNLYNSWAAHLCADIPVFIIGLIMLKMI